MTLKKREVPLLKDVSANNFFRDRLDRFAECLQQSSSDPQVPFFLFTGDAVDAQEVSANMNEINTGTDRRVVIIHTNGHHQPRHIWKEIPGRLYDIMEWTNEEDLMDYVRSLAQRNRTIDELLNSELVKNNLIGESNVWKMFLRNVIEAAVFSPASILLIGESGTGKELLSRLIHTIDGRHNKKDIVLVDCTTIMSDLSGSEFFGHEKGAYTNAVQSREGAFSLANQGTLFLDEIGELPLRLQAELLRVIQEGTYKKIGSNTWHKTNFRLVSATNKNIKQVVKEGAFRHDLYFRIADFEFRVPPLKERPEDIPLLAQRFLQQFLPENQNVEFDENVLECLVNKEYEGNVRELRQVIRRIALKHMRHKKITVGELALQDRLSANGQVAESNLSTLRSSVRTAILSGYNLSDLKNMTMEEAIQIALDLSKGNKEQAARKLGVTWRAILQFRKKTKIL